MSIYLGSTLVSATSGMPVSVDSEANPVLQSKTVTPSETAQTVTPDSNYDGLSSVKINAISSDYVGSGITRLDSNTYTPHATATQIIKAGQYLTGDQTIQPVPTETMDITTNGTYSPSSGKFFSSVTVNVVNSGSEVKLQEKSATPTVTTQTITPDSGYDGLSKVTVSGVGGTLEIDENGTYGSVTSNTFYNRIIVNVPTNSEGSSDGGGSVDTASATPSANSLTISFTGLSAEPTAFAILPSANITLASTRYVIGVKYDGQATEGICGYTSGSFTSTATAAYSASNFTWSYSDGTLTVTSASASTGGYFRSGIAYKLLYTTNQSGGSSSGGSAEAVIEPLTVTENGTYTAPSGVDGYSPITVNVLSSEFTVWDRYVLVETVDSYSMEFGESDSQTVSGVSTWSDNGKRIIYADYSFDETTGVITLSNPLSTTQSSSENQLSNYASYPYYYGDKSSGTTDNTVYKITNMTTGGTTYSKSYTWSFDKAVVTADSITQSAGDFIENVASRDSSAYPTDGAQNNYWYTKV